MFHRNVLYFSISPSILHPVSICIFDDAWYFNLQCIIRGTKEIFSLLDVVLKRCTLNFYKVSKRMNPEFKKMKLFLLPSPSHAFLVFCMKQLCSFYVTPKNNRTKSIYPFDTFLLKI